MVRISHHAGTLQGGYRKGGALRGTEKRYPGVALSIDSLSAAHDGQKLGPRKGSADLFCRSAALPCP